MLNTQKHEGFTLIELLVVISIVGLLSTLAVYAINVARVKARDTKRKADLVQIQKALELYYDNHNHYPQEAWCDSSIGSCGDPGCPCSGSDWDYTNPAYIGPSLRNDNILKDMPKDPINNTTYYYAYEPDCNQERCPSPLGCCYYSIWTRLESTGSNYTLTGGKY